MRMRSSSRGKAHRDTAKRRRPVAGWGAVCALLLTAIACGGGPDTNADGEDVAPVMPRIATSRRGLTLADELPGTVPVPRGAVPISILDREDAGAEVGFLVRGNEDALKSSPP